MRAIIFYNFQRGLTRIQCFEEITSVFSDAAPCLRTVERWYLEFQRGHSSLSDKSCEGRPKTAMTQVNVDAVPQLIVEDRHVTYREIEASVGISGTTIHIILHEELGVKKLISRWIPHLLSDGQKTARVKWCRKTLQRFNRGESKHVYDIVRVTSLGYMLTSQIPSSSQESGSSKMSQTDQIQTLTEHFKKKWLPRLWQRGVTSPQLH